MIKQRLDLIIKELGLTGRKFEKACGLANGSYSSITDGVGADKLRKILIKFPQLSAEWLITGNGVMMKGDCLEGGVDNVSDKGISRDIFDKIMKLTDTIASQQETIKILASRVPAVALGGVAKMAAGGE